MLRGTRIIAGRDADLFNSIIDSLRLICNEANFDELIVPAIWERDTFYDKVGLENQNMMWTFPDKGGRDCCLIPEVTGLIQQMWRDEWSKTRKSWNVFYATRCYRYERPQAGRYREFTQFGIEMLGAQPADTSTMFAKMLLKRCVKDWAGFGEFEYTFEDSVKRGLSYYVEDGFEVTVPALGAQKQIAGGGRYAEGIGWALGVDRLFLLAKQGNENRIQLQNEASSKKNG